MLYVIAVTIYVVRIMSRIKYVYNSEVNCFVTAVPHACGLPLGRYVDECPINLYYIIYTKELNSKGNDKTLIGEPKKRNLSRNKVGAKLQISFRVIRW